MDEFKDKYQAEKNSFPTDFVNLSYPRPSAKNVIRTKMFNRLICCFDFYKAYTEYLSDSHTMIRKYGLPIQLWFQ